MRLKNRFKLHQMKPIGNSGIMYRSERPLSYFKFCVKISLSKFETKRSSKVILNKFFKTIEKITS